MSSDFFTLYSLAYFLRQNMLSDPLFFRRTWTSLSINYLIFQWVKAKLQFLRNWITFQYLFIGSNKASSWMFFTAEIENGKYRRKMKLLLLVDHDKNHYCLIENFSNLMHHRSRSSSKRVGGPRTRFCGNCMQSIVRYNFSNHVLFASTKSHWKIITDSKKLTFENWQKRQLNPFVVYADLEAIDLASDGAGENNYPKTIDIERQYPASFGPILVNSNCKKFA